MASLVSNDTTSGDIDNLAAQFFSALTESIAKGSGQGSAAAKYMMALSRVDRYNINAVPLNSENHGLTFITRPKLNLHGSNLGSDRILSTLRTEDPRSWMFAIRMLLDTELSRETNMAGLVRNSPWLNSDLPFILPLTNQMYSISGFPDINLETETTDGGYYGEDLTFVRGGDMNYGTYDLSLTFNDIQGGFIMALFTVWVHWMRMVTRGMVVPYMLDSYFNRLCYTCSIYRFVLDPSHRYITKWGKATGCFPTSVPIGAALNISDRDRFVDASRQFTIPFKANTVEMMDPIIFQEFNTIVSRYAGWKGPGVGQTTTVDSGTIQYGDRYLVPAGETKYNFAGIPWIDTVGGRNELQFWALEEEIKDNTDSAMDAIIAQVDSISKTVSPYEALSGFPSTVDEL